MGFLALNTWSQTSASLSSECNQVRGHHTVVLVFGVWYLVFGIWYLVFGIWYLVFGIWYLVFGI